MESDSNLDKTCGDLVEDMIKDLIGKHKKEKEIFVEKYSKFIESYMKSWFKDKVKREHVTGDLIAILRDMCL